MTTDRHEPNGTADVTARAPRDLDRLIGRSLLRATDVSGDAWAILEAVRDGDRITDLRLLYANDAYARLTGLDLRTAIGQGLSTLMPTVDWTRSAAARLMRVATTGEDHVDRAARIQVQAGPFVGQERVFELEFSVEGDILSAGFRDITDDWDARERAAADARRSAALARFLQLAVDPAISRTGLLDALAASLADTLGDLVAILEVVGDSGIRVAAVAGGPGDLAEQIRASHVGRTRARPEGWYGPEVRNVTVHLPTIPADIRERIVELSGAFGLPPALGREVTSLVGAWITIGDRAVGRIHLSRFGDRPGYADDDRITVESLAAAAALVLERRDVEDQLAQAFQRFEAMFEQAPVPMIFATDEALRLNDAACTLFGRSEADIQRSALRPDSPWIPDDQGELWATLRRSFTARERVHGMRFALLRPDGERREVEGSAIPLSGPDQRPIGLVVVFNDLTERESLEAQLRHAQKMEALGRLAGGIAHDFNNVLMGILGYAEFLAADIRSGTPSAEDADQVVLATRRAIDLTARLTTFSRREAARRQPTDVSRLIETIMPLVRRLTPESIVIEMDVEPVPLVLLDGLEFEQVIVNLVVNAVDAMPGGGRLTIECSVVDVDEATSTTHRGRPAGRYVLVAVSDTGVGMDEATRSRIFEPFYTTKHVGQGTGLGLSMVFGAVERAGGSIWVYSEPGLGTTFKLYLPPTADQVEAAPAPPVDGVVEGTETVLVVEDDRSVRELVERGLRGYGYRVLVADRPSHALALAAGTPFDILLTDVVMPEMTGDAVAAALRAVRPDLPVVFMSGYTARALEFELGPLDTLVHKPLSAATLARAIRAALEARVD
jgi:two-component system, cell cycle sensor histidine kinase and response regulator CckA